MPLNFNLATVLLRNLTERGGPSKLCSHWENQVYVVVSRKSPESPVYKIMPEGGGKSQVVHRNLLLPCDNLPVEEPALRGCERKKQTAGPKKKEIQEQLPDLNSDSEDEEGYDLVCRLPCRHGNSRRVTVLTPDVELHKSSLE
ncbi:hypothetical protein AAFF_G00029410 [Aldrovandia affinis]|uniref:Uncharacterized protein n=1 Tax=Aldrovandia affinis TaxID=143900 RepID=A0AAD7S491_9TELE|nr:hypothetical protein AAFF_G00029410 [Aldrovandia affinis]